MKLSARALFVAVGSATLLCATAANAQDRRLQFDLNSLAFQFLNSAGAPSAFPGTTATGTFQLFDQLPTPTTLNGILIRTGGVGNPFVSQSFTGGLTHLAININLVNGAVTGGSVLIDLNGGPPGGDSYTATIAAGGSVQNSVVPQPGSFTIESLTGSGHFSDANLAGISIPDFFPSSSLTGDFLSFKITPNAQGAGFADTDLFVNNIPAPGSASLLGLGGILAFRRRR
jgi:hypothetical protein